MRQNKLGHHVEFLPGPADPSDVIVRFLASPAEAGQFDEMRGFEEDGLPGVGLTVHDIERLVLLASAAVQQPENSAELLQFVREKLKL